MKSTLILVMLLLSLSAGAQLDNQQKIVDVYGQEWVTRMESESPQLLTLIDKYVTHGFMVKSVSPGKYSEFTPISAVPLSGKDGGQVTVAEFLADYNSGSFNPLEYGYFPQDEFQVYKLQGVDFIIYILPQQEIMKK